MAKPVAVVGGSLQHRSGRLQIGKRKGNNGPGGDRLESESSLWPYLCDMDTDTHTYAYGFLPVAADSAERL